MQKNIKNILCIALCLCLLPVLALGAGKATIVDEYVKARGTILKWVAVDAFVEIENTGDKTIEMDGGLLELFDPEGDVIDNKKFSDFYPAVLQPGEKGFGYYTATLMDHEDPAVVDDCALSVTSVSAKDSNVKRLDVGEVSCEYREKSAYLNYYALTVTVTNNTEETIGSLRGVFAGRDGEGKLAYAGSVPAKAVGILPGSSITLTYWVEDLSSAWKEDGSVPATFEAIVYGE